MKKDAKNISSLPENASLGQYQAALEEMTSDTPEKETKKKNNFTEKLSELWGDKRKFSVRAILAALCAIAFSFTFIVFGPYELYISSMQFLTFAFSDLVMPMAVLGAIVAAVLFIVLIILRGKIFNYALSSLFSVTLAGYLQGNFFNLDHGALDGSSIPWADMTSTTLKNLAIWFVIAAAVFALMYFSRKIWAHAIQLVCVMLIGAQIVALSTLLINTEFPSLEQSKFLSDKGINTITENENVVFFLLDRFDNHYADKLLEQNPEWYDKLSGFTYYHNFTGSYTRTCPSVAYLLTGVECDYKIPFSEYFAKAWKESDFLRDIREAGYTTNIYTDIPYTMGNSENVMGVVDNLSADSLSVNKKLMYKYMLSLSAYRYAPEALKPSFWLYTGDLANITSMVESTDKPYTINDPLFWRTMWEKGIEVDPDSKGTFNFFHLGGSHEPFIMDENGNEVPYSMTTEAMYAQTTGNMNMIFRYIEELKAKGVYDNTTIIISADHGMTGTQTALDFPRMVSLFVKPANADTSVPMTTSNKQVCHDNLRSSILSYFGLSTEGYPRTIESIGEEEELVRIFKMQASDEEALRRDVEVVTYEITGDANDFNNWKEVKREPILCPFYDTEENSGL